MKLAAAQTALNALSGATFVGIDTVTTVKLTGGKKNPMQGRVTKKTMGSKVMCFSNTNGSAYNTMVKRRLAAEGKNPDSFELSPRAWGERVTGTSFVTHKGAHYLEVIFLAAGTVEYQLDGVAIAKSNIEGMPASKPDTGQGGLDDKVVIRTFALDSVIELRAFGATHN